MPLPLETGAWGGFGSFLRREEGSGQLEVNMILITEERLRYWSCVLALVWDVGAGEVARGSLSLTAHAILII